MLYWLNNCQLEKCLDGAEMEKSWKALERQNGTTQDEIIKSTPRQTFSGEVNNDNRKRRKTKKTTKNIF